MVAFSSKDYSRTTLLSLLLVIHTRINRTLHIDPSLPHNNTTNTEEVSALKVPYQSPKEIDFAS
jgi:hypothetical protein